MTVLRQVWPAVLPSTARAESDSGHRQLAASTASRSGPRAMSWRQKGHDKTTLGSRRALAASR
eukprot:3758554-Rhodomonas_salina.1